MASLSAATDAYVEALAALQVLCNFFPKDLELATLSSKWRRIPLLRVNNLTLERMLAEYKPVGRLTARTSDGLRPRWSRPSWFWPSICPTAGCSCRFPAWLGPIY